MREPSRRRALLLGCTTFADQSLPPLRSPRCDVEGLERVLRHPRFCRYDVSTALDCTSRTAQRAIEGFLADARTTDGVNLLYLSCHGVQDERGRLYFAFADTERDYLSSTAVAADWVRDRVYASRSKATLMLIDCCFSGAFIDGMRVRSGGGANVESLVIGLSEGSGVAVLTASGETEVSFEDAESADVRPSYFTEALIAGLSSGEADLNRDSRITVDELYEYVYDRVVSGPSPQRPQRLGMGEGALVVADAAAAAPHSAVPVAPAHPVVTSASVPPATRSTLHVRGVLGYASFDGQWVVIGKDGVGQAYKSERRFHVTQLIGVAGRPATRLHHGFFQVLLEAVEPAPIARFGPHKGRPAMEDFASISYSYTANDDMGRLAQAVQAAIVAAKGTLSAESSSLPVGPPGSAGPALPEPRRVDDAGADARNGARDGEGAMMRIPLAVADSLASGDFDVVRWLAPWREHWARGGEPASWLPGLARHLGRYAAPPGHPDSDLEPSPAYLAGFRDGLRHAWSHAAQAGLLPADRSALRWWMSQPLRDPKLPPTPAGTTLAQLKEARSRAKRKSAGRWLARSAMWLTLAALLVCEIFVMIVTVQGDFRDENGVPFVNQTGPAVGMNICFFVPIAVLATLTVLDIRRMRRGGGPE